MEKVPFLAGETLFVQGAPGDAAYIVESGAIDLYHVNEAGQKIHLGTMTRGCLFGEMSVIDGSPRMATAIVRDPGVVLCIPAEMLRAKLQGIDPFVRGVIKILMENLRTVHRVYLKVPRSFDDHATQLRETSESLARFCQDTGLGQAHPEVARTLAAVTQAAAAVEALAAQGVGQALEGPDPLDGRSGLQT